MPKKPQGLRVQRMIRGSLLDKHIDIKVAGSRFLIDFLGIPAQVFSDIRHDLIDFKTFSSEAPCAHIKFECVGSLGDNSISSIGDLITFDRIGSRIHMVGSGIVGEWGNRTPIDIIVKLPSTASHITTALLAFFVYHGASIGSVFFHASSVMICREGHLFIGLSDAGKSTIAKHLGGKSHEVLGEEFGCIRLIDNEQITLYPVPFDPVRHHGGYHVFDIIRPLKHIWHLSKESSGLYIARKFSVSESVATLFQHTLGIIAGKNYSETVLDHITNISRLLHVENLAREDPKKMVKYIEDSGILRS